MEIKGHNFPLATGTETRISYLQYAAGRIISCLVSDWNSELLFTANSIFIVNTKYYSECTISIA